MARRNNTKHNQNSTRQSTLDRISTFRIYNYSDFSIVNSGTNNIEKIQEFCRNYNCFFIIQPELSIPLEFIKEIQEIRNETIEYIIVIDESNYNKSTKSFIESIPESNKFPTSKHIKYLQPKQQLFSREPSMIGKNKFVYNGSTNDKISNWTSSASIAFNIVSICSHARGVPSGFSWQQRAKQIYYSEELFNNLFATITLDAYKNFEFIPIIPEDMWNTIVPNWTSAKFVNIVKPSMKDTNVSSMREIFTPFFTPSYENDNKNNMYKYAKEISDITYLWKVTSIKFDKWKELPDVDPLDPQAGKKLQWLMTKLGCKAVIEAYLDGISVEDLE